MTSHSRRTFVAALGAGAVAALAGCSSESGTPETATSSEATTETGTATASPTSTPTPENPIPDSVANAPDDRVAGLNETLTTGLYDIRVNGWRYSDDIRYRADGELQTTSPDAGAVWFQLFAEISNLSTNTVPYPGRTTANRLYVEDEWNQATTELAIGWENTAEGSQGDRISKPGAIGRSELDAETGVVTNPVFVTAEPGAAVYYEWTPPQADPVYFEISLTE